MGAADADSTPPAGAAAAVYGHKMSTVVPASATGDVVVHEFSDLDLALKTHYVRAACYFRRSDALDRLCIMDLKRPMFHWLDVLYPVAGRVRRRDEAAAGRPFVKCNDCGVRIVEANCGKTLDEWLDADQATDGCNWKLLVPDKVLGPDLHFSPTVYIQFTRFKCGGMAIGYSWAHVLGDAVAAADCINLTGQFICGNPRTPSLPFRSPQPPPPAPADQSPEKQLRAPLSVKQVQAGDHWLVPATRKMSTFSFPIPDSKLDTLREEKALSAVPPFEIVCAALWFCLAKVRQGREPSLVTVCRNAAPRKRTGLLSNELRISTVSTAASSPAKLGLQELAMLLLRQEVDETELIEDLVAGAGDCSTLDVVVYGANLTFADMDEVDLYGLEMPGCQKPVHVELGIDGVADEGAVLVFGGARRRVQLILPEEEIPSVREVLVKEFDIA